MEIEIENKFVIEKGILLDVNELEALYNELNDYLSSSINYPGWIKHIYPIKEDAIKGVNEGSLFVLREEGTIVGSIILNHIPEDAYSQGKWFVDTDYKNILVVRTLVVHPLFMKKNIGMLLMQFAKQHAISKQLKSIRLDVSEKNIPAIRLYEKSGYNYIGTVDLGLPYEHLKWFRLYELVL